jgi:type II secretory pathway component PulF
MSESAATLDDFMALNEQLAALAKARVPLDVGWTTGTDGPAKTLERINAAVARQVSRGATLEDALRQNPDVPSAYRCLVQVGLQDHNLDAALEAAQRLAETRDTARYSLRTAFLYPVVVCLIAYIGLIGACTYLVPNLEGVYAEFRVPTQTSLHVMQSVRNAMPIWIFIPPVLIAIALWWIFVRRSDGRSSLERRPGLWARLTGQAGVVAHQRLATFAESLAVLLEAQTPFGEALTLAAGAAGDPRLTQAARELAADVSTPMAVGSHDGRVLPPFLRWAILSSEPTVERPRALRMAASIYHDAAEQSAGRLRVLAPALACLIIGGGAVLLYGLSVFIPVIDLYYGLSIPPAR